MFIQRENKRLQSNDKLENIVKLFVVLLQDLDKIVQFNKNKYCEFFTFKILI